MFVICGELTLLVFLFLQRLTQKRQRLGAFCFYESCLSLLFTSPVPHDNYANDSEFSVLIKCPKYLYVSPLKGGIAPKGQQNIAQCNALGKRIPPPPKLQRPERAAEYPKGNALMSKTIKC